MKNLKNYQGGGNLTALKAFYLYAFIFLFFGTMVTTYNSFAQTPNIITYQGKLTMQGSDVSGERTITARLYADDEGTEKVWEGTYKTYVTDGIFALPLGAGKYPLPSPTKLDKQLWVGITIDGIELRPLTQLTSSPYALNVADKSITKAKLADELTYPVGGQNQQIWDLANGGSNNSSPGRMDFIGGGENDTIITPFPDTLASWDVIAGGEFNKIDTLTEHNIIGGGKANLIQDEVNSSGIVGGDSNTVAESYGSIGGGKLNRINKGYGTISGGFFNAVDSFSAIPGGRALSLNKYSFGFNGDEKLTRSVDLATNGLGQIAYLGNVNTYLANTDNIARELRFYEPNSNTPGGGIFTVNDLGHYTAFKAQLQEVNITYQLPPTDGQSGSKLTTDGYGGLYWDYPVSDNDDWELVGNSGTNPTLNFVGTKDNNALEIRVHNQGAIAEGRGRVMRYEPNNVSANIIGGFNGNKIQGSYGSYIGSGGANGDTNAIYHSDFSVIAGGRKNSIALDRDGNEVAHYSVIGGGYNNKIETQAHPAPEYSQYVTIAGGKDNLAADQGAFIGGGDGNSATEDYAVVNGGINNSALGIYSVVGGGIDNIAIGVSSTISGGQDNYIAGLYATIPGGRGLKASSHYKTSLGKYNKDISTNIFEIGNGTGNSNALRSNAYEVSEGGHSRVFQNNGNTNSAIVGTRYIDNTPIAYGYIDAAFALVPTSSFGCTKRVLGPGMNQVTIWINYTDPYTGAQTRITGGSVVATVVDNSCSFISTSTINWVDDPDPIADPDLIPDHNEITITTSKFHPIEGCQPILLPLMFHVFGRP